MANDGDNYRTPDWLFDALNAEFGFTIDVAADADNRKVTRYISARENALITSWGIGQGADPVVAWCNPPYSKPHLSQFLARAVDQAAAGVTAVLLIPLDPSTAWARFVVGKAAEVRILVPGRLRFDGQDGLPAPTSSSKASCVVVYRPGFRGPTAIWAWHRTDVLAAGIDQDDDAEAA